MADIWITGTGCLCGAGRNVPEAMTALYEGRRDPRPPVRLRAELEKRYPVFEVSGDLAEEAACAGGPEFESYAPPAEASRTTRMAWMAVTEACREAGLSPDFLRSHRVGVALGTTVGCTLNDEPFYRAWRAGKYPSVEPIQRFLDDNPALAISKGLGLTGPAVAVANACSSGADAIGLGRSWLEAGVCDVVLAGGADELSRVTYLGFISLMITSTEACRPFDRNRTGLNLGEGAGIVVLEKPETARERGVEPVARLLGYGSSADAFHPTAPHPEGRGLRRATAQALREAEIDPSQVGFVNAHGTSTSENDRVEGKVVADLYGPCTPVVSTKAFTGHTLGAAGGIEAVFTVWGLADRRVPSTPGFEEPDPDC
ncbi:beta-ketoacyl-[acyl-carrier-protein] synthase family protein, partial [bacterium]|nr:beta-ketoacyl-[acyl-carrier-protein] synthase family protein [bacterium]